MSHCSRSRGIPALSLSWVAILAGLIWACGGPQPPGTSSTSRPPAETHGQDAHGKHVHGKHAHGKHTHGKHTHGKHAHGKHAHGEHDPGAPLGHRFERAEEWVPRFDAPGRDAWQQPERVIATMAIDAGMVVADIGAGTGYFLPHLSSACGAQGRVLAVDIEPDMVRYLKERAAREQLANVEPRLGKVDTPALAADSVDRILMVNTWHHVPNRVAYATELARSLRADGQLFVVDYTLESERGPPKHHKLSPSVVMDELRAAGFSAELDTQTLPDQYIVIARKP